MKTVVLAGMGKLPYEAVKKLQERGESVAVVAFTEQIAMDFSTLTDDVQVFSIAQVGKILKYLKSITADAVLFIGKIDRSILEANLRFDIKALSMLAKLKDRQEDTLMLAIIEEIKKLGVSIYSQRDVLSHLAAKEGLYSKHKPSKKQWEDIAFGFQKMKAVAALDIGQSIVVKNRTVLAVEAIDGTNETIKRGAGYARGGYTFVKVAKPEQDYRFDLPTVGLETL
ncbi:MAG: UDP-2,3-diacylglucosamine diphosphatase LpxI, partial [Deferribacteraceae bacterium]|nr:UDP-2,3-diacylglucosamine diphosphatase LpxI [Deferribacteraceae bacterium]